MKDFGVTKVRSPMTPEEQTDGSSIFKIAAIIIASEVGLCAFVELALETKGPVICGSPVVTAGEAPLAEPIVRLSRRRYYPENLIRSREE